MTETRLNQTWDLDSIFSGGSASTAFDDHLRHLASSIAHFSEEIDRLLAGPAAVTAENAASMVLMMQDIAAHVREAGAFISCLNAQDVKDTKAQLLTGRLSSIRAKYMATLKRYDDLLALLSEDVFAALLCIPAMAELEFVLRERIRRSNDELTSDKEALIAALSVDGYAAWGELYDTIVGRMNVEIEHEGKQIQVSMGQLANRLLSADSSTRERLFVQWEEAWAKEADLCAGALNHLAGYRLAVYEGRGWSSFLKEPLDINRMSQATLDAMWHAVSSNKMPFVAFLEAKAKYIGVDKLRWADVDAPIGDTNTRFSYEEARDFIVRHFRQFNPDMADFAASCFDKRWIEAEDRPGKRPGGFCTSFPVSGQTRIFVTFSGTPSNVATLAHELGHAYHQHIMRELPQLLTNYAMNVAETASTFAEMIVSDASVKEAKEEAVRLSLLEDKVGRSISMFMNIHARFLFETRYYEARKRGMLSVEHLNQLMMEAQKEAFGDALADTHPHFWASKLHFYMTGTPFYNFPYTFGYLFSTGIYARAVVEGPTFSSKYVDLLRDTGRMQVEDLAMKHLGVDLTKADFWQSAVDLAIADANAFVHLANQG